MSDAAAFTSHLFTNSIKLFSICAFQPVLHYKGNFNLVLQVLKEKKPLADWSNITGSAPCMMSLSPLTIHKPPQVFTTHSFSQFFSLKLLKLL